LETKTREKEGKTVLSPFLKYSRRNRRRIKSLRNDEN